MSDTSRDVVPPPAFDDEEPWPVPSPAPDAGGMLRFAAMILCLTGLWQAVVGVIALTEPAYFRTAAASLPLHVGYTTLGWVHVVVGVVALACGFGVLAGNRLAAVVAVVLAVISAVVNLVFLRVDPVAAIVTIVLDVLVIWVVTAQAAPPPRSAA